MEERRDQSDCTKTALRKKFKEINEEFSPPPGLEYNILQRVEGKRVGQTRNFSTGIRFIIKYN